MQNKEITVSTPTQNMVENISMEAGGIELMVLRLYAKCQYL
jgi:hypothetical protein